MTKLDEKRLAAAIVHAREEEEPFMWTEAVLGICLWTLLLSVLYGMFFL